MSTTTRCVIAYDVSDNGRRARIARRLESLGERVQGSVFEADLDARSLARLQQQLARLIDPAKDGVRIYRLCSECARSVQTVGQARVVAPPGVVII